MREIKGLVRELVIKVGVVKAAKVLIKELVIKVGAGKAAKALTRVKEIKDGQPKARDGIIKVKDLTKDKDSIKDKDLTKDGTIKIKVLTKAADNTGITTHGLNKIRAGDQEDTFLCLAGKINTIASYLQSNLPWVAKNVEDQVHGSDTVCRCLAVYAIKDKEYARNATEEVLISIMASPARNVMEESGKNVMGADVRAVVQAIAIDSSLDVMSFHTKFVWQKLNTANSINSKI